MLLDRALTRRLLDGYQPFDETDARVKVQFGDFLETVDPATGRSAAGVLTAAGWIVDIAALKILLVWNEKLQLWLNPGGKYEPGDGAPTATMRREVSQEAGITAAPDAPLFDISYIGLDYNPRLPCPMFDCRFLVTADSTLPLRPQETDKTPTWFPFADTRAKMPDDIQNHRLYRRTERLFSL